MATTKAYVDSQIATVTSLSVLQGMSFQNEVMNFPSLEGADNAQPQWWEEADANATLTEVDIAGESITETYERGLKVVVATANSYAYQRYTYADQPRLKSGRTVSCAVAVWSVSSVSARVRLQSSVGSLGVSSDTTTAGWTVLRVEAEVLDGTYVDLRLEVDVGTAYFVPLGFHIGSVAFSLEKPRGLRYRIIDPANLKENLSGQASKAMGDIDVTAETSPLAVMIDARIWLQEATAADQYNYLVRPNWSSSSTSSAMGMARAWGDIAENGVNSFVMLLDDQQIFETELEHTAGAGTINGCFLYLHGWWEWE